MWPSVRFRTRLAGSGASNRTFAGATVVRGRQPGNSSNLRAQTRDLVERVRQFAPARDDRGIRRIEEVEQLDQPGPDLRAVVTAGTPNERDQPVERRVDQLVEDLDIGGGQRRVDVVG